MYDEAVDWSYWTLQIGKIFECFPKKKFTVYNNTIGKCPNNGNYPNVLLDIIDNL